MTSSWMLAYVVPALLLSPDFANRAPVSAATVALQPTMQPTGAPLCEEQLVSEIIARSFPNLTGLDIRLKRFRSETDWFLSFPH